MLGLRCYDSDPACEEAETELKASAMLDAIVRGDDQTGFDIGVGQAGEKNTGSGKLKRRSRGKYY